MRVSIFEFMRVFFGSWFTSYARIYSIYILGLFLDLFMLILCVLNITRVKNFHICVILYLKFSI
ncbi:hypothetical protein AGR13a_Cc260071 [Agrobacterium genomosp. 13 str. CFBP 6927]|uniref:Uncharacterized protein n=1 Tax=Agrobacterium genomosp. 13 str. CFBP 6927 TaxID=1183428 RepID=A0ABM9VFG4_9HYPH|nr:hypothetical protein AGR13a_Cc260071 [Agrobacterium genomosp. 13 str. CFBP 6927]